jgi:hypothetical protein
MAGGFSLRAGLRARGWLAGAAWAIPETPNPVRTNKPILHTERRGETIRRRCHPSCPHLQNCMEQNLLLPSGNICLGAPHGEDRPAGRLISRT